MNSLLIKHAGMQIWIWIPQLQLYQQIQLLSNKIINSFMESWFRAGGYTQPDLIVNQFRRKTADTFSVLPNFSSADWGPFMASKEKNVCQMHTFLGGVVEWGTWPYPHWKFFRAKFSEASFPHFKTCFMQISLCYL